MRQLDATTRARSFRFRCTSFAQQEAAAGTNRRLNKFEPLVSAFSSWGFGFGIGESGLRVVRGLAVEQDVKGVSCLTWSTFDAGIRLCPIAQLCAKNL